MEWNTRSGKSLRLQIGDITKVPADAIVNAANSALAGGGGVDGAIHRAGGPSIMRELDVIRARTGGCPTGSAVVTGAGSLPAKYVFHAVGPVYRGGGKNEAELLASCYSTSIDLAEQHELHTISFPAISTGIYGYPIPEAAAIAIREISSGLERSSHLREAIVVLFDRNSYEAFAAELKKLQS
jgi:O-acetyl-ADP-ribose deacetylase (regulator of RNase III)